VDFHPGAWFSSLAGEKDKPVIPLSAGDESRGMLLGGGVIRAIPVLNWILAEKAAEASVS
jgi:hypothetical protein